MRTLICWSGDDPDREGLVVLLRALCAPMKSGLRDISRTHEST